MDALECYVRAVECVWKGLDGAKVAFQGAGRISKEAESLKMNENTSDQGKGLGFV